MRFAASFVAVLLALATLACQPASAEIVVVQDMLGPDSSLTDGMPGASTIRSGEAFAAPGINFTPSVSGTLSEARLVIFVTDGLAQPVNDPAAMSRLHLTFNLWQDGIQGGADSFEENPGGESIPGHINHVVTDGSIGQISLASIVPYGHSGPPGDEFKWTTFLVSADLSGFEIGIEAGREYVFNLFQDLTQSASDLPGTARVLATRVENGTEDVWYNSTHPFVSPGFVQTQLSQPFKLFGSYVSVDTTPPSADFDNDGDVDGADFLKWQRGETNSPLSADELALWQSQYGTPVVAASVVVPEPSGATLKFMLLATAVLALGRSQNS